MKKSSKLTRDIVLIGMFAAILAVLSQIALPLPTNVPITLQTFAVALTGYFLGWKNGSVATLVYVLIGAVGVPVFANWSGGFSIIVGYTGGFIYGFIVMAFLCGLGGKLGSKKLGGKVTAIIVGICGLAAAHILGVIQYSVIADISVVKSFLLVSLPFLIKDIVSVIAAYLVSEELIKRLAKVGIYGVKKTDAKA